MPGTAKQRGLADPFEPASALKAAIEYLSELRHRFGNLGLAAAAYNACEKRVEAGEMQIKRSQERENLCSSGTMSVVMPGSPPAPRARADPTYEEELSR